MFMHGLLQGVLDSQGMLTSDAAEKLIIFFVVGLLIVIATTNRYNR